MKLCGLCPVCCVGHLYVSMVRPGELLCTHCRNDIGVLDLAPVVPTLFDVAVVVDSTNPQPQVEGWPNP